MHPPHYCEIMLFPSSADTNARALLQPFEASIMLETVRDFNHNNAQIYEVRISAREMKTTPTLVRTFSIIPRANSANFKNSTQTN